MALLTAAQNAAEVKRKAAAGIALTNTTNTANNAAYKTAVSAQPKVTTPTAVKAPVASVKPTTPITTPVQTSGAAVGALAGGFKPSITTPVQGSAPTTTPTTPTTSYVANGGQTLNDLLYLKRQYESGKTGAAAYATPLYGKLDANTQALVKGMDSAKLEAYINGGQTATTPTETAAVPQGTDYASLAQAAYEREQAAMDAAAGVNSKEIGRRYAYANNVTQDNRTLQDASIARNDAPTAWDGSGGYRGAMLDRTRGIEDHYTSEGLTDAQAGAYSQANAFRTQSGNYMETKANELQTADKNYNLQVADRTGLLNGEQTMQGAANSAQLISQNLANKMATIDLSTYSQSNQLKLQQLQQQVKSGAINNDTAAYQLSQLTDPNSASNQAAALDLQIKQIDASTYSEAKQLQLQQLKKTIAEIGKTPYTSASDQRMDELKIEMATIELEKMKTGTTTSPQEYAKTYVSPIAKYSDKGVVQNKNDVIGTIVASGLDDNALDSMFKQYGITEADINAYRSANGLGE